MADVTVRSGANTGTRGNDYLATLELEWEESTQTRYHRYYTALYGLSGDDTLRNNAQLDGDYIPNVIFDGGDGNDDINNYRGQNPSISGGDGDDTIFSGDSDDRPADNPMIYAGAGNDFVKSYGENALISGGDGDNQIYSDGDRSTITSGGGKDLITTYGDEISINSGAGNDTIYASGNNVTIESGDGDDHVNGYGEDITIRGGAGNDSLWGHGNSYDNDSDSVNSKILLDDTIGNNYFYISNSTNSTIQAGAGDDTVNSDGYNKNLLINAGAGNNSIVSHYDSNITINSAAGNDKIYFYDGKNALINAGEGDNYIYSYNFNLNLANMTDFTISSGAGKDTISTYGNRVLIVSGAGNDSIRHVGANSTIFGGEGDDYINNHDGGRDYSTNPSIGANNLVEGGAGNDSIYNSCENVTLNGGEGDDYISSGAVDGALINGGSGNDSIYNTGNINREFPAKTTLNGGEGDDFIDNLGNNVTIDGGAGNDTISLRTGRGPGYTYSGSENVLINYVSGDGNDIINYFDADDTLKIVGGTYSSVISGSDVILTVGNGKITLNGAASLDNLNIIGTYGGDGDTGKNISNTTANTLVTGTNNADTITNSADNVTIQALGGNDSIFGATRGNSNIIIDAGDGNDVIETYGSNISVNAGNGNDSIHIFHNEYATVLAGAGNDTIFNTATDAVLDSGEGNDFIHNDLENVTITGGADDDIIENYGDNVVFNYSAGDGNDFIRGFDKNSTLAISGTTYTTTSSGSDVILTVGNGKITLNGAATVSTLNIIGDYDGEDTTPSDSKTLILTDSDKSAVTIGSEVEIADASARTKSIKIFGNDSDNTIIGGSGNDKFWGENGDDTFVYTSGKDIINDYDDGDTISLTSAYSSASIKGDDVIFTFDSKNNLTVKDSADKIIKFADGTTFGGEISDSKTLTLTNADKSSVTLDSGVEIADASARTKAIKIYGNDSANTIIGGSGNDKFWGEGGDDLFVYTAGKDIINDYDDGDKISLSTAYSSTSIKGDDVIFTFDSKNSLTVKDSASKIIKFSDGTTFGGEISDSKTLTLTNADKSSVTLNSGVEIADASARTKSIKIYGNDLANTIIGGSGNDKICGEGGDDLFVYSAGKDIINDYDDGDTISLTSAYSSASIKGDDVIFTFDSKNSLTVKDSASKIIKFADGTTFGGEISDSKTLTLTNADKSSVTLNSGVEIADASQRTKAIKIYGNDLANTIIGGSGNDKFWGEGGDDTFVYTSGKDIINDYDDGDTISLSTAYSSASIKGDDVIFTFDSKNSLTVKDSASKIIKFADGTTFGGEISDSKTLTLTNADKSSVTLGSGVEIADASARTKVIKIYGNDLANTIIGGSGNDKFWGEGGSDTFIYSDGGGKDYVYDFGEDDLLEIVGEFSATYKKSTGDVVFKVGDGSITLKDTSATIFNVNGENYHISGTKLVK